MNENISRNYFEICEKKLTGESSIGILGTLIAGFSISLIPNIVKQENCECILWTNNDLIQEILIWINTLLLGIVSIISGITVMYSTGLYWRGMKILSKRENVEGKVWIEIEDKRKGLLKEFNNWWDDEHKLRITIRRLFISTVPLFILGISFSNNIWCNNCILGLIVLFLFMISSIILFILSYRINFRKFDIIKLKFINTGDLGVQESRP